MNDYEHFMFLKKNGLLTTTEEEHLRMIGNDLLQVLYKPSVFGLIPDWRKIKACKIDSGEPINWADLKCGVERKGDCFLVTIEEASPGVCPSLCEYVEKWLTAWGWNVIVETEW